MFTGIRSLAGVAHYLVPVEHSRLSSRRFRLAIACAIVFLSAYGVRWLHWQDSHLSSGLGSLTHLYLKHAKEMVAGRGLLLPRDFNEPSNAQLLVHPPGYSIFVAAIFRIFGESTDRLIVAQIVLDSAAALMITVLAAELFPIAVGLLAGLLVAFSPHLAHYSLYLLPDSLSALPLLIAAYLIARGVKRPSLITIIAVGFFIGLSCWLRSNALLLALFVAVAVWLLFERGQRLRYALALIASALVTILPITIRNWMVFDRFIPLSLGSGITLIEGIGDYDKQNRFGMPSTDRETKFKDVEWHNRPDYGGGLWMPDGIERDRYRFRRGIQVIAASPLWFAEVMIQRAGWMLSYNSPTSEGWPFDTARVPIVAREPSFGHRLEIADGTQTAWTNSPEELKAKGRQLAPQAETSISPDGQKLEIAGDGSEFGDQIAWAPIAIEKNTDYVLRLSARLVRGRMAAKVTDVDRRITLASSLMEHQERRSKRKAERTSEDDGDESPVDDASGAIDGQVESPMPIFEMPFASGDRSDALLVISNNGASSARPEAQIGQAELYRVGETPNLWTRHVRPAVRGVQRNLFTTSRMLTLVAIGIVLVAIARRKHALLVLLVVPMYYLCVQSVFHTEYRYILAIHYFLFIMAATACYCAGRLIWQSANLGVSSVRRGRAKPAAQDV